MTVSMAIPHHMVQECNAGLCGTVHDICQLREIFERDSHVATVYVIETRRVTSVWLLDRYIAESLEFSTAAYAAHLLGVVPGVYTTRVFSPSSTQSHH